jgi:hypothetical protein
MKTPNDHDLEQARAYATHLREMLTLARPHIHDFGEAHTPECHCIRCEVDHCLSVTSGIDRWPVPPPIPETATQGEPMPETEETREEAVANAGNHPLTGTAIEVADDDSRDTLLAKVEGGKPIGEGIDLSSTDPHEVLADQVRLWLEQRFAAGGWTAKNLPTQADLEAVASELDEGAPESNGIFNLKSLRIDTSSSAANLTKQIEEATGEDGPVPWTMDRVG